VGVEIADLPAAVHLVAEPPVAHAVGVGVAVLSSQIGPRGVPGPVAVLHPRLGLVHRPRAHVDADERLGAEHAAVLDELVGAESVGLLRVPGQLAAPETLRPGADTVEPVVAADEVAARPPQDRNAQRPGGVEDVAPEAALVAERRALVVDAAVDAAAQVLDELPEDARVHGAQTPRQVDADAIHRAPLETGMACRGRAWHTRRAPGAPKCLAPAPRTCGRFTPTSFQRARRTP
jgi:hypothetical protein